jgi:exopolysaccharide biosynthesis polyprenyl glycosylphosphotransferase
MLRWKIRIRKLTYLLTDLICILVAYIFAEIAYLDFQLGVLNLSGLEKISFVMLVTFFLIVFFLIFDIYTITIKNYGNMNIMTVMRMMISLLTTNILLGAVMFYFKANISRLFLLDFMIALIALIFINRLILKKFSYIDVKDFKHSKNILVIGWSERGQTYINEIKKHNYLNFNLVGYISINKPREYDNLKHIATLEELDHIVDRYVIDEIAVARPLSYDERLRDALHMCQDMGITITMLLDIQDTHTSKAQVAMVGDLPVLKFHVVSLNENQLFMKRIIDIFGSLIGMVFFGLAFIIIGPLIKLETSGPIIFKQDRVGQNGRVFKVWKFRSMGVNAEKEKSALMASNEMQGHMFKMSDDPRVTKIGAFIRKTSIDELPQFYNVLKGDMSLVGTRPPTVAEVKAYEKRHRRRISIVPGITGKWQVSGRSNIEDFEEIVRLDSEYISEWCVWLDIKILFKTIIVVFKRDGSH